MCHAAAWLIDGSRNPPHGDVFWKWARLAEKRSPGLRLTTCHSYEINQPYKFTCTNSNCGVVIGRHSKKGLDVSKYVHMTTSTCIYLLNPSNDTGIDVANVLLN